MTPPRPFPARRIAVWLILCGSADPLGAQTISVVSVENAAPDLGTVVSAVSGDTVFRIAASDGSVAKVSGSGARLTSGTTRALVTVTCTGSASCASASDTVTIGSAGTPTGRAQSLTNFTVAAGPSAPTIGTVTGTDPVSFTISGIPEDGTRNFYVGADFGIADSGSTGAATSGFSVSVTANAQSGAAQATVYRPISLSKLSDLSFGSIVAPTSGGGSVSIDATTGSRDVAGTGAFALASPTATRAQYAVAGEGGQAFSVNVPSSFDMTGPGTLTVTLSDDAGGSTILSSTLGSAGSFSFHVGGSFSMSSDTPSGTYSGTFAVTVQYN